ncbi:unnamed protein product [Closterium sp. Naga37s-1]|nr:unnamed protein product [Closterium sp. Naga37s-1]
MLGLLNAEFNMFKRGGAAAAAPAVERAGEGTTGVGCHGEPRRTRALRAALQEHGQPGGTDASWQGQCLTDTCRGALLIRLGESMMGGKVPPHVPYSMSPPATLCPPSFCPSLRVTARIRPGQAGQQQQQAPSLSRACPSFTPVPLSHPSLSHTRPSLTPVPLSHPSLSHTRPSLTPVPLSHPSLSHTRPSLTHVPLSHPSLSHTRPSLTPVPLSHPSLSHTLVPHSHSSLSHTRPSLSPVAHWLP